MGGVEGSEVREERECCWGSDKDCTGVMGWVSIDEWSPWSMEDAESHCNRNLSSICSSVVSVSSIAEVSKSPIEDIEFLRGRTGVPGRGSDLASSE